MSGEEGFLARWSRRKREAARSDAAPPERPDPAAPEAAADPPPADALAEAPAAGMPMPGVLPPAEVAAPSPAEPGPAEPGHTEPTTEDAAEAAPGPAFDLAGLSPVEGPMAEADVAALFRPGVPAALRGAVLRRMWTLDPAIRDFVGPADYAWDYNAPGGVPGSTLELGGEVARLLSRAVGPGGEADGPASAPDAAGPVDAAEATAAGTPETVEGEVPTEPAGPAAPAPGGGPVPDLAAAEAAVAPDEAAEAAAAPDAEEPVRRPRRHGGARPT
jgi:hypothetical protein